MAVIKRGDRGSEVSRLQDALVAAGFPVGVVDGVFGVATHGAVRAFQSAHGLGVDGMVGPQTMAALEGAGPTAPAPTPPPTPSPAAAGATLTAVETPGGGRISDKTEPASGDLVSVSGHDGRSVRLHWLAATAWGALTSAAREDGITAPFLEPMSGYRSIAQQQRSFDRALERYGSEQAARRWVAKPGGSPHHSGRAVDCWMGSSISSGNVDRQRETAAWGWLDQHAEQFGFYPYTVEPWHWEYNPPSR